MNRFCAYLVMALTLFSVGCGARSIPVASAQSWLAESRTPAQINITGDWRSTDWGNGSIVQTGNKFKGVLGSGRSTYNVRGVVTGKRVRILFLIGDVIWWTGEMRPLNSKTLRGHFSASGAILNPRNKRSMHLYGKVNGFVKVAKKAKAKRKERKTAARRPPPVAKPSSVAEEEQASAASAPAPATEKKEWYYGLDNERQGPVTKKEILRLFRQEKLARDSLIWKKGMKSWKPLSKVPELAK